MLNKKGFTLIEFMISMTVFFILVSMSFANYVYFQNVAKVKISLKELSQTINITRNLSRSGLDILSKNQSVAINIKKGENNLYIYSFDYNKSYHDYDLTKPPYKTVLLQKNVIVNKIFSGILEYDNILLYYPSIKGEPVIYTVDGDGKLLPISNNEITVALSYKNASNKPLYKEITYNKLTNIVDY